MATNKQINVILSLRDRMTGNIKKTTMSIKEIQREVKRATNNIKDFHNKAVSGFDNVAKKATKTVASITALGTATAAAITAATVKQGFAQAADLEGYRLQLETATKSAERAGEIMRWATDFAAKTPFESGELVEAASKLEMMSLTAEKYIPLLGDMAAATNKPIDQAVEALIDAQTGELERLKEFGIRKQDVIDKAAKTMRGKEIVNNKGQITDQKRFNDALVQLMTERFEGGMEKQSKSLKGLWSTVTDLYKTNLARIIGIADDGSVRAGSAYEFIKTKVDELGQWMNKLVEDGTITRIGNTITENLPKAIEKVQELKDKAVEIYTYVKDNWPTISATIRNIVIVLVAWRAISAAVAAAIAVKTTILGAYRLVLNLIVAAQWAWNVAMTANPIGLIITLVAGLVVGLTALGIWFVKNTEVGAKFWDRTKELFRDGVNWVAKMIDKMIETLNKIPGVNIKFRASSLIDDDESSAQSTNGSKPAIAQYATGTSFSREGLATINERGGELVELPSGTKVLPADKTNKLIENSKGGDTYQIIIHGNVYGEEDLINKVGNGIFKKVKSMRTNM